MTEPMGEAPATSFLDSLGPRGRRRAEPRTSISIAGAGCALAVLGVLTVAGDSGASDGDFNKVPGIILSALLVGAGFFALSAVRHGAVATAGTVAAVLGVPALMFFLTFDQNGVPPYSTDGILIVSTIVWLGAYGVGPGRGRPFFLAAGLIGFWFTVLQLTEKVFEAPFGILGGFAAGFSSSTGSDSSLNGPSFHLPDPTNIGVLSLGLGVAYLLVCRWLDKEGHRGAATPFAVATLPTLVVGAAAMIDDLEQAGTGLLVLLIGAGLAFHGASLGRRATAWLGGTATAVGAAVFLADMTDDATIGGMLFIAGGIGLVAAGHAIAATLAEPDEMLVTPGDAQALERISIAPASTPDDDRNWAPPADDPPPP
jgi:hypothetical protein